MHLTFQTAQKHTTKKKSSQDVIQNNPLINMSNCTVFKAGKCIIEKKNSIMSSSIKNNTENTIH